MQGPSLVAIRLHEGARFVDQVAEAWDAGHAVLPIGPRLPGPEIERILDICRPGFLRSEDRWLQIGDGEPVSPDTAVVLLTSGSTGPPKAVELSHGALRASAAATHKRLGVTETDRWLCCLPLDHVAGFVMIVRSMLLGNSPVIQDRFDPADLVGTGATLVSLVPTQLKRVLDAGIPLHQFKTILLGGSAIPGELVERAGEARTTVVRTYGMTETCGGVVYDGLPLDGVAVRLNEAGRIEVRSPSLFTCYRRDPELTEQRLRAGWFDTGDLGRLGDEVLTVIGRADDVIITGGENVTPSDVEGALIGHPWVEDCVVLGIEDETWGQRLVAVVVPPPGGEVPTPEALRAWMKDRVAPHKIPKDIFISASIPRSRSGKPDLAALRDLLDL